MTQARARTLHSWIAAEHARLHLIASWPASTRKEALLQAIHSTLRRLLIDPDAAQFRCLVCRTGELAAVPRLRRPISVNRLQDLAA